MPMNTNGVYQDHSVPGLSKRGVGKGVAYPVNRPEGMGGNQYKPASPGYAMKSPKGHDGKSNSTYK